MTTKTDTTNPLIQAASLARRLDTLTGERFRVEADPAAFVAAHFAAERASKLANASAEAVQLLVGQKQVTADEAKAAVELRKKRRAVATEAK